MKSIPVLGLLLSTAFSLLAEDALPPPWKHQDIGAAEIPGAAAHSTGTFTLEGTKDLWGTADGCHLAWQPLRGDAELVARVTAMENPGKVEHAKASLCLRESLDAGSRGVTLCVTPGDGTQFLYRDKKDGITIRIPSDPEVAKTGVPKGGFPCWLKLVRRGDEISGYESVDGEKWVLSGRINLDLADEAIIGLAASSHKRDTLTKAVFDRVKVTK